MDGWSFAVVSGVVVVRCDWLLALLVCGGGAAAVCPPRQRNSRVNGTLALNSSRASRGQSRIRRGDGPRGQRRARRSDNTRTSSRLRDRRKNCDGRCAPQRRQRAALPATTVIKNLRSSNRSNTKNKHRERPPPPPPPLLPHQQHQQQPHCAFLLLLRAKILKGVEQCGGWCYRWTVAWQRIVIIFDCISKFAIFSYFQGF